MLSRKAFGLSLSLAIVTSAMGFSGTVSAADPAHLTWAEDVALNVAPEFNAYGYNPDYVYWPGVNGATAYQNRTVCNQFVTRVLMQAYGWDATYFRTWLGAASPLASTYHDAIADSKGFARITDVGSIQVGDIIAVKYPPGSSVSGHMMMVVTAPTARAATRPLVNGALQWAVEIVDSTSSNHGAYDTRLMADGTVDAGAGIGTIRLYTDANGAYMGHTWSTSTGSTYYDMGTRHIEVGRLNAGVAAQLAGGNNKGNKAFGLEHLLGGADYTLDPEI